MTRDFVFSAPPTFPEIVAIETERFELRPHPRDGDPPVLVVAAIRAGAGARLEEEVAVHAAGLLGVDGAAGWTIAPVRLLGFDGCHGRARGAEEGEGAGLILVRAPDDRLWAFGWRAAAGGEAAEAALLDLMQGLQARTEPVGEKSLLSQFHGQERKRRATIDAAAASRADPGRAPDASDRRWDARFADALGESEAAAARFFAEAVALVEQPYGEIARPGASRIGGGPDLPPGAWPCDTRGMRHPFLMQIDLAEIAALGSPMDPLPASGLLSFFVHGDALEVDAVYTPAGVGLVHHPIPRAVVDASAAAIAIADGVGPATPPGPLPHTEGDLVTAERTADGGLAFFHTPDPVWAVGEPGSRFEPLSDPRWASVASARLRPRRTRSFDFAAATASVEETRTGSIDDLEATHEAFEWAWAGRWAGTGAPQVHGMFGHATISGGRDCRREAAEASASAGHADLADPTNWITLVRLRAGSATGRVFWDAEDLVVMAPAADIAARRWDRCLLLAG